VAIAVAVVLFLPGLGSVGLWEPLEMKAADLARLFTEGGKLRPEPAQGPPEAMVWLSGQGMRLFGLGEWGGRLPSALAAIATVAALVWTMLGFASRRAALAAGLVFVCSPGVLLGGRQVATPMPLLLAVTLLFGGLLRALVSPASVGVGGRVVALLVAGAGLALALPAGGLLVGALPPLVALAWTLPRGPLRLVLGLASLGPMGYVVAQLLAAKGGVFSSLFQGAPHAPVHTVVFSQQLVKGLVQLFPFVGLLPLAVASAIEPSRRPGVVDTEEQSRAALLARAALGWLLGQWLGGLAQAVAVQDVGVASAPAAALLIGLWLDEVLRDPRPRPLGALVAAMCVVVIGRDILTQPEVLIGAHLPDAVRWPGGVQWVPGVLFGWGMLFAGLIALGLGTGLGQGPAARDEERQEARGRAVGLLIGSGLVASLLFVYGLVPILSKQLSSRDLFGKTARLDPKAPLGQYRFGAAGSTYYAAGRSPTQLNSTAELLDFLSRPERVFVLAGAEELASVDKAARQRGTAYVVIDDSNARYLVLSNRTEGTEQDLNPLRRFVSTDEPKPRLPLNIDFEGKLKLLGYDLPDVLDRGQDFRIRLYFQVVQPLDSSWKVFLHFDGQGGRFHGDHVPLEGRFPTQHWTAGTYVIDEHLIQPERNQQSSGSYRIFMGLYQGDTRLKVSAGPQDGENRAKLGSVIVK
jgi:4-amino-4-deoxy-L-arabinose transferase-like glycosyltransferase